MKNNSCIPYRLLSALLLLMLFTSAEQQLSAQTLPILVSTSVVPPYDPDLSVWERNPNRVQVTLTNTSATESFNVRVAGFAEGLDNGVRIEIKNDFPSDPILLAPSATVTLNARQTNLFDPNAVRVTGADRDAIALTRQLPEGDYRICLRALDHSTLAPLSAEGSGCAQFGIKAGELPRLFSPPCEEETRASNPQFIIFQWTRPSLNVPVASLANLRFRFVLVPIPDGRSPQEALESASNPLFLEEENITNTFYQLGPADPWLEVGKSYAWRVQVSDPDGTQFENNGWSEACSFTFGSVDQEEEEEMEEEGCDPPLISVHFPNNRNSAVAVPRVPYRYLPVVATYAPFCPNLKSFASILNIRDGATTAQSWSRTYTWETGLLDSLREKANNPFVFDEDLLTPTVVSNASTFLLSAPSISSLKPLRPGVPLQWQAHVTTVTPDDVERKTTKSGMVSVGLDAPILEFPKDGARLKSDALRFEFTTSPRPADSLLRPIVNVLAAEASRGGTAPSIPVKEVWMLEVARTPFTNPATTEVLYSRFGTVSSTLALSGKSKKSGTTSPAVLQEIYKSLSVTSGLETEQDEQYYWRVKWLVDNQLATPRSLSPNDTAAYAWSPVSQFTIDANATDGDDCLRITGKVPTNTGLWQESLKPQFAVQIEPSIDSTKITGAQLQIWNLKTDAEKSRPTSVTSRTPDFEQEATGTITSGTFLSPETDSITRRTLYEVQFVNHPGSIRDFVGVDGGDYAWRLILRYDGATIRTDKVTCPVNETVSSLATFRIDASPPDVSPEECLILTPTSPEFGSKIREEKPTFAIEATPPINPNGIDSVTIEIWKMKRATEKPDDVVKRAPVFRKILAKNSPSETRLDVNKHLQAILDSGTIKTPIGLTFVNGKNPVATFTAEYDTNYLWQVSMTVDPRSIRLDGEECFSTQIKSAYGTFRRDTSSSSSNCPDSCSIAPPKAPLPRTDTVPTFGVNQKIKIGRFTLTLESVVEGSTADNLSGEGVINIPFMRKINVAVEFTGLRVNAQRQVYSGNVTVQRAENTPLPSGTDDALGMDNDQIQLAYAAATDGTRLLSNFVTGEGMMLPIGFDNNVDGEQMTIGIIDMIFKPTGAYLAAVFSYPLPQLGPDVGIGLGARNICFSPTGIGGDGKRELYLAADLEFKQEDSWGFRVKAPTSDGGFVSDSGTYVAWDCNGFQAMRLRADVFFPRKWMVPITPEGEIDDDPTSLVTGSFATTIRKGAHWLATASLSPFAPASMPDLHFAVESMVIDQSDLENDPSLVFPPEYKGDLTTAWRGFALQSGRVRLPEVLRTFDTGEPPAISVKGMMIDKSGITGTLSVANLIPYPQGNFAGWAGGIDTVSIRFVSNSFAEGSFAGKIGLPITREGVGYSASFAYSQQTKTPTFTLNLKPQDTLTVPLWVADLKLNSTATITLTKALPDTVKSTSTTPTTTTTTASTSTPASSTTPRKKWVISATLTGDINIAGDAGVVPGLSMSGLHFEGVGVKSVSPYLLPGTWSLAGFTLGEGTVEELPAASDTARGGAPATAGEPAAQSGVAGFPLSITGISPVASTEGGKTLAGIQFTVVLNLMGGAADAPTGFSGGTRIQLWGELSTEGGQKFSFSHASLDSIGINADFGPTAHVEGFVRLYKKDETYGTGFYGAVEIDILSKIQGRAIVQIGSVKQEEEDVRYWFIDMQALFEPGIPLGNTGVSFYGAGGGIWYKMSRSGTDPSPLATPGDLGALQVGRSLSGYQYKPDPGSSFGFKVLATLGAANPATFNSDLAISVQFTDGGGLGEVALEGQGYMMAGLQDRQNAKVKMQVLLSYRPPEDAFHGLFDLTIDQFPYYANGRITMHVDPDVWYMRFGEPSKRINFRFLDFLSGGGYMMVGNSLPPGFGGAGLQSGGIAFGANVGFSLDEEFLIFFGKIKANVGFDVTIIDFGDSGCNGISPIGFNGWYARGKIYAEIGVKIGVQVKLFLFKGRVTILEGQLKASLEGGFPKPFWAHGKLRAKYRVMGGLVKGTCRFEFGIGKKCEPLLPPQENPLDTIPLVTSVSPSDGMFNADLAITPEVEFSMPIGVPIHIPVLNRDGTDGVRVFLIEADISLTEKRAGFTPATVPGVSKTQGLMVGSFYPLELLGSELPYTLTVFAQAKEWKYLRVFGDAKMYGWWVSKRLDGSPIQETHTTTFTTGVRPDILTPANVLLTIPATGQRFYIQDMRDECATIGQIVLKRGAAYLLEKPPVTWKKPAVVVKKSRWGISSVSIGSLNDMMAPPDSVQVWKMKIRFTSRRDGKSVESHVGYWDSEPEDPRRVDFTIPKLAPSTMYRVDLIRYSQVNRTGGITTINPDEILYTYHFATSRFTTLEERIAGMKRVPSMEEPDPHTDLEDHRNLIATLKKSITPLEETITGFNQTIASLKGEISGHRSRIDSYEMARKDGAILSQIANHEARISQLTDSIVVLEDSVINYRDEIDDILSRIASLEQAADQITSQYYSFVFDNGEGFDLFDTKKQSIFFQGTLHEYPLLTMTADKNSRWHHNYVNSWLFPVMQKVSWTLYDNSLYRTQPGAVISPIGIAEPLTNLEILFGTTLLPPTEVTIIHRQGLLAKMDYNQMVDFLIQKYSFLSLGYAIIYSLSARGDKQGRWLFEEPYHDIYGLDFQGYSWPCGASLDHSANAIRTRLNVEL